MSNKTFLYLLTIFQMVLAIEDPVVELPNGKILGRQATTYTNTPYYAFQKIPYAAPPVGELRFKAPQPADPWDGILNTTYLDVSCYQGGLESDSEDCLFVNVYTPTLPADNQNASLPVMLFIHGGAFIEGWSLDYQPDLFIDNEVILVTINYRLGVFGFLSTGDEVVPGNNGLKDQRLAIQWTHENVHLFGGDPEQITIFGESAGSASVAYQLLDQSSEGLFRAAILESGSFLSPWADQRNARRIAFETAGILNSTFSTSEDSNALLEFLQSVSADDLDAAAQQYRATVSTPWDNDVSQGLVYAPVIEVKNPDAFITKKMYGLLQAGNILKVPVIMGINSEENLLFNQDPVALQSTLEAWDNNLDFIVPNDMQITDSQQHADMAKSIRDIYTNGEPFGTRLGDGVRYSTDNTFSRPVTKHAELASAFTEIYFYQFSYDGLPGGISIHYDGAESVGHAEELSYLFCVSAMGCSFSDFTESDTVTSQRLIKLWTNFAKYQNPTPEVSELFQNITWSKLSVENGDFLYLDINEQLEIKNHIKAEVIQKWNNLYESLNFTDFDTY
ncbi:juvenile hormone esterase-like [Zophobas morio]|uniref:juvenile hormone esterase-like n=1 Tax=Zophobas morio TaxID=2755281 RepID=UPI00308279F8